MEDVLKKLGFKKWTGHLWKHEGTQELIEVSETPSADEVLNEIVKIGIRRHNENIKKLLSIRDPRL